MVLHPETKVSYNRKEEENSVTHTFLWIIPNFLEDILQSVRELRTVKRLAQRPQLKLQVWGHNRDIIELSCLFQTNVFMQGTVILDAKSKDNNVGDIDFGLVKGKKWFHLVTLYRRDINKAENNFLNSGGDLRLKLNLNVFENEILTAERSKENKLSNILQDVLKNSLFSDAIIKSNSGKEYKVHKVMLAGRSAVLKAHFEQGTTESITNVIQSPFDSEVLEELLSYIYSDKVSRLKEFPKQLLAAADYYQLDGLKAMCEEELSKGLGVENAMELLELATSHQAVVLKQSVMDCVKKLKYLYEHVDCTDWDFQYVKYDTDDEDDCLIK